MASVFLSYDHEDLARASPIALALESNGHSVWWDRHLHGGAEYNSEIESAVEGADVVVVLWSAKSIRSAWVRDEAGEGRDRGRLVPVLIEPVKPPMGFRQYQAIDLSGWSGGKRIPHLADLLLAVDRIACAPGSSALPAAAPVPPPSRAPAQSAAPNQPRVSRRAIVGGAVAAAPAASVGGGLWWAAGNGRDPRFDTLLDQAGDAVRNGTADEGTTKLLKEAVSIRPRSARAWGLLALARSLSTEDSDSTDAAAAVAEAQKAAQRALSLSPKEPNALLAMFELEGSTLDWITRDQRLRQIIAIDPANVPAISELVLLTQATGLNRESWNWNERALALVPSPPTLSASGPSSCGSPVTRPRPTTSPTGSGLSIPATAGRGGCASSFSLSRAVRGRQRGCLPASLRVPEVQHFCTGGPSASKRSTSPLPPTSPARARRARKRSETPPPSRIAPRWF